MRGRSRCSPSPPPAPHSGSGSAGAAPSSASLLTLDRLPRGYRVLYTGLAGFAVLAVAVGLLQQALRSGLSPRGAAEWILGNAGREGAARMFFPSEPHEVLDEMWRRSLGAVLPAVVLSALLFRSAAPAAARWTVIVVLVLSAFLEVLGPGVIWLGDAAALGWVWFLGQAGLGVAGPVAAGISLRDIWSARSAGARFRRMGGPATSPGRSAGGEADGDSGADAGGMDPGSGR